MVREVTAWQSDDGSVYPTQQLAAEADVRFALKNMNIFNEGSINAIVQNARRLAEAIKPLADLDKGQSE